ncbi:MAG: response regulator [Gammaproteobacteria bacterium]|nr:response regulator [Gammaproteobacteria bacterium]NIR99096.1 response regulator [Gammaproteobacteria bacterium]NIT64728.1 response regulator [Gammaproteobacteria bacterium]NIV21686.1 response regulator [Gammaproteobacteria bacterium]NIX10557.1 response regulator [Gammaproteobacteria bacterium]
MRVLLIDDHALFRVGLEGLLERRDIDVAASVPTGEEGMKLVRELEPDVILLDMRLPEQNGIQVLRRMREEGIDTPIVMLTTSDEERDLIESLRNGAQGYLLKDMDPDELVQALQEVTAGRTVVAPELSAVLAKVVQHGDVKSAAQVSPFSTLTPREQEILCHLAEGQSNKVIAKRLGISDGTVKLHVKAILRKLGVHSRVEAAVIAVEQDLCQKG